MTKLIVGCGFLGTHLARQWHAAGHRVIAIVRSASRSEQLKRWAEKVWVQDVYALERLPELVTFDTVVFAVSFPPEVLKHTGHVPALRRLLGAMIELPRRFVYISSTGVYGKATGRVDETSSCKPDRITSHYAWEAERWLESSPVGSRLIILRMAGLYGPERIPRWHELQAGLPLAVDPEGWLNLIHVEDAAQVIRTVAEHSPVPARYNVADGHPVRRCDFFAEVARLFATPPPRYVAPDASDPRQARSLSNRQVDTTRLKDLLRTPLKFASYREGLQAVAQAQQSPRVPTGYG